MRLRVQSDDALNPGGKGSFFGLARFWFLGLENLRSKNYTEQ
jgi:hypothetical protein